MTCEPWIHYNAWGRSVSDLRFICENQCVSKRCCDYCDIDKVLTSYGFERIAKQRINWAYLCEHLDAPHTRVGDLQAKIR